MIKLWDFQQAAVDNLRASMRGGHKNNLLVSPTGSGKTVMATYMVTSALEKGMRAWFVAPRRVLVDQTAKTFDDFEIYNYSYISSGKPYNPYSKVYCGCLSSVNRRIDRLVPPDIAFIDECHYGGAALDKLMAWLKDHGVWVVGLSGSPWRLDGKGLGCYFSNMIETASVSSLIDNGFLSKYRAFAPDNPDMNGVKVSNGDYQKAQLSARMEQDKALVGNAAKHYRDHAMGALNIAYCVSIKHSKMTADMFREAGIPAAHIDGETDDLERRNIIKAFARRELLALCNVDLMTFGFDLAAASGVDVTVECMSDLRPTQSLALQLQKWGRVLRKKDYPAKIFDHANNFSTHGFPCDTREWTLLDREKKARSSSANRAEQMRQCMECFFCHRPAPACPNCGNVYPVESREVKEVDGELSEIAVMKREARIEQGRAQTLQELIALGYRRGYKPGNCERWAAMVYSARRSKR